MMMLLSRNKATRFGVDVSDLMEVSNMHAFFKILLTYIQQSYGGIWGIPAIESRSVLALLESAYW